MNLNMKDNILSLSQCRKTPPVYCLLKWESRSLTIQVLYLTGTMYNLKCLYRTNSVRLEKHIQHVQTMHVSDKLSMNTKGTCKSHNRNQAIALFHAMCEILVNQCLKNGKIFGISALGSFHKLRLHLGWVGGQKKCSLLHKKCKLGTYVVKKCQIMQT